MVACLVAGMAFGVTSARATAVRHPGAVDHSANAGIAQQFAAGTPAPDLPAATAAPAPAPPALDAAPPLQPHEIFAFAPWWNIAQQAAYDVKDMTTLAYFSLDVLADGSVQQSGAGWNGYQSQALADLVTRAHAANDRVVLTATCFDQRTLDLLTSSPDAPARLGAALVALVSAKNLDGVNFDFEGQGPRDRIGLDRLIGAASAQLHAVNPHWQVTMSTYASSAGDPSGFFDVAGLSPSVDGFFVMAYDMDLRSAPSPTAPLTGPGNSDTVDLAEYTAIVPSSKVILGVPYYGYDWPTAGPDPGAPATGPATPVGYSQVAATGAPSYWDRTSQTPWTAYLAGTQWHQVYFDDPTSLALKARLANADHIAGIGVWALGMDGNDPAMLAALLGNARPAKYLVAPASTPTSTTTTTRPAAPAPPATTSFTYSGSWNGTRRTLEPVDPSKVPGGSSAVTVGQMTGFTTTDPADACLSSGLSLPVEQLQANPGVYLVRTTTPGFCVATTFEFIWTGSTGTTTTTSTTSQSTTTTTSGGGSTTSTTSTTGTAASSTTTAP